MLNKILIILILLQLSNLKHVFYEQLQDGTYIVAVPRKIANNSTKLKHELSKHFHINSKHQEIQVQMYPRNQDRIDIQNSKDRDVLRRLQNLCFNGKKTASTKQKVQEFKYGKCSPVVIVPGILATSLVLSIDCEKLMQYKKGKIFQNCGWDSCNFLGINSPDSQYLLWVGLQLTLKLTSGFTKCFGDLFGLMYNKDSNADDLGNRYYAPAGLKSTWLGNDDYTKDISKCGSNAIRDLSGHVSLLSIMGSQCALKDYARLIDMLEAMGYEPGLTMQALPYDFRYGVQASTTPKLLPQIINNLYHITGKKVVIVGHSLGTVHTLSGLAFSLTKQEKQKMVRHYIPITPPWFGTVSAIRNLLYGDQSYFTESLLDTGINRYAQMKFTSTAGSTYDLFLRDAFQRYRNQNWMQQILKRIQYEKEIVVDRQKDLQEEGDDYPLNWFPSRSELCFDPGFKTNPYCQTGFIDFVKSPMFDIKGKKYYGTRDSIRNLLYDNLPQKQAQQSIKLWQQTLIPGKTLSDIPAPQVNTSIIFTTLFETQIFYKYDQKPLVNATDDNQFVTPMMIGHTPGDISVPSFSPLVFIAKWIHENTNKNHTVQAIEYCGHYKGKKKHYSSLTCQCYENPFKNALDCTHPCIISDKYLLAFVIGILTNKDKGYKQQNISQSMEFSDKEYQRMQRSCMNLHPGNKLESFKVQNKKEDESQQQ